MGFDSSSCKTSGNVAGLPPIPPVGWLLYTAADVPLRIARAKHAPPCLPHLLCPVCGFVLERTGSFTPIFQVRVLSIMGGGSGLCRCRLASASGAMVGCCACGLTTAPPCPPACRPPRLCTFLAHWCGTWAAAPTLSLTDAADGAAAAERAAGSAPATRVLRSVPATPAPCRF